MSFSRLPLICFLSLLMTAACLAQATPALDSRASASASARGITLSPGDSISVTIFDTPELSVPRVQVEKDGNIKLPELGDVHVSGLTASEVAHMIDMAYRDRDLVLNPQSSVVLLNFATNGVSIIGEVAKPGNYPVTGSRTLVDIIAMAGGLTTTADTRVTIQRSNGTLEQNIFLPLDNGAATLRNDVTLSPGDKVVVQRAGTIYVLGDVARPGGYLMQYNGKITALQAVAQASGTSRTSGENNAVLIRRNGDTYTTERLPLRDMYKGKVHDVILSAGDVIYVPASNARNFVFNAPEILGTLAGAAIYSVNR
jgi:polysaccharide export outer membrane protein